MLERSPSDRELPAPLPAAARAAVSPLGLALAGAGVAIGLAVGAPLVAVVLGAGFWGARVGVASVRAAGRRRRAARPEPMDPYAVPDPWRRFVRESLTAESRFDQAVARVQPGPLRERLEEVAGRVHDGVRECWRVAHLGAALDAALAGLDPEHASAELRRFQDTYRRGEGAGEAHAASAGGSRSTESLDETEAALAAQLQAARRVESASQRATDRLRVLTAQLNAAVASAVELSLDASEPEAAGQLAGEVDTVVGEIEALRQALEETSPSTTGRGETRPAGGTPA